MGKNHYVYLAGNISDNPQTYEWRDNFEQEVEKRKMDHLVILNPCRNNFNRDIRPRSWNESMEKSKLFNKAYKQKVGVLPLKDYQMIKICTILVANLKVFTKTKPIIGTIYELAWARMLNIPVIAIVDENDPLGKIYSRHPFQEIHISERVRDECEAIDLIQHFFMFQEFNWEE